MARDSQTKMSKKDINKKREEPLKKKKLNQESSDDDASLYTDDDSENELDVLEYRKFLKKMFPSKHLDNKINSAERLNKILKEEEEDYDDDDYDDDDYDDDDYDDDDYEKEIKHKTKVKKNQSKKSPKKCNSKKKAESETEEEVEEEKVRSPIITRSKRNKQVVSDEETEDDNKYLEDEEEEDDNKYLEDEKAKPKSSKFNIIFTIGGRHEETDEDEDETWETCSDENTENEDDPVSSDSDTEEEQEEEEQEEEEDKVKTPKKELKKPQIKEKNIKKKEEDNNKKEDNKIINKIKHALRVKKETIEDANEELTLITMLKELQSRNKDNKLVNDCIRVCEQKIKVNKLKQEKKIKKEKDRNSRIFKRILRDKNTMNDYEFYDKLDTQNQKKIIKELREINKITRIEKPYRLTLLESDIPVVFKAAAMKKISSLRYMEPGSGEYHKIKIWVDTFMQIPFSTYKTLPISFSDGVEKCHDFMSDAQKILDEAVYGLNDAKMQIMQMLGQLITNPKAIGSAIAIHGPPGTGKTSLVKEGISKILNRPFAFIALGGATDSSFLEGHGYTYEGSTWGKIVQILIASKCMNPVIYFDELDKISDTPKGEEIAGILTHLTDTSQNSQFHDKYFSDIDFDLSKCLFIFSYNDESKINPILKDRMYRIQTKGYNQKQKTAICNNYLLPKIREQVMFEVGDIVIPEQTISYIIENYCNKEDGVRNLKRCLEIIYTKLNLYRLMRPDSNLFEEDMSLKVVFPFTVTKDMVDKLIKKTDGLNPSLCHLYI